MSTELAPSEIQTFLADNLLSGKMVTADEELLLTGLIDSLGVIALVSHLESATGRSIPPEDVTLDNFSSVGAIAEYLNN